MAKRFEELTACPQRSFWVAAKNAVYLAQRRVWEPGAEGRSRPLGSNAFRALTIT